VLLAMDWPDGKRFADFLGFAILRSPGFRPGERQGFLRNKIGFNPPQPNSQPLTSDVAPFQKFHWWDGAISEADRGKTFKYTITPVRGTGPDDLVLQHDAETTISLTLPQVEEERHRNLVQPRRGQLAGVLARVSRSAIEGPGGHGLAGQRARGGVRANLVGCQQDRGCDLPSDRQPLGRPRLQGLQGKTLLVYEDRSNDRTDRPAIDLLDSNRFEGKPRSKTNIMHDKFLVDLEGGRVLMGSANFTPEGLTTRPTCCTFSTRRSSRSSTPSERS
jgi:hypothetical protein